MQILVKHMESVKNIYKSLDRCFHWLISAIIATAIEIKLSFSFYQNYMFFAKTFDIRPDYATPKMLLDVRLTFFFFLTYLT